MRKIMMAAVLGSLMLTLAGCGDLVKQLEKKTGIAVTVEKGGLDACAYEQVEKLVADYQALSKAERKKAKTALQARFKQIVIRRSVVSQFIRGEATTLFYAERVCGGSSCWDKPVTSKRLAGNTIVDGTAPVTQLDRSNERLTLQAQASRDESLRKLYVTRSVDVYDQADSVTDEDFILSRQLGHIYLDREIAQPTEKCGKVLGLAEILN
jgi:hypothetical protein